MASVARGDVVLVRCAGRRSDGDAIDSPRGQPLELVAGSDDVIEGLSTAVVGMEVGERRRVTVPPERAFGQRRGGLERRLPRRLVPADARVGECVEVSLGGGVLILWIVELGEDYAVLDGNHPWAGQALELEIEVVEIRASAG